MAQTVKKNLFADIPILEFDAGNNLEYYAQKIQNILDVYSQNPKLKLVINLSLGSKNQNLTELLSLLPIIESDRALVVAAAGNEDSLDPVYPSAYPGVISVGAVDSDGNKIGYSNHGSWVSIYAEPNEYKKHIVNKLSLSYGQSVITTSYKIEEGTSFASPKVAANVASIWAYNQDLNASQVRNILYNTAKSPPLTRNNRHVSRVIDIDAIRSIANQNLSNALLWRDRLLILFCILLVLRIPEIIWFCLVKASSPDVTQ